ncbi:hypothetical protein [Streptomyces sp. NPDC006610]|uniref:hypothetical protein n=1 Tax=Streptomyces sp. NPDC006610 TaxID=3154584 RepID=UPI0033A2503E
MIRTVGFFLELSPGWHLLTDGSIRNAVKSEGEPDEKRIISYLINGTGLWSETSAGPDVLDPDAPDMTGVGSLRTDGLWIWREDLHYYVAMYHVSLSNEFLAHVRSMKYTAPAVPASRLIDISKELGILQ